MFVYTQYDSSDYWRGRADGSGQSRVLWTNEEYNLLYRHLQREILRPYVANLKDGDRVLDIGCGIGVVARMMVELNPLVVVDALDFSEMIQVAQEENPSERIHYIAGNAEEYFDSAKHYQVIISSACFAAIKDITKMEKAISNCIEMLDTGGILLMIDPFHRWNYLARVKYSSKQVIAFCKQHGLTLKSKSGVLFWPYRDWLANSRYAGEVLQERFAQGERLLSILGTHKWADYKILVFAKDQSERASQGGLS